MAYSVKRITGVAEKEALAFKQKAYETAKNMSSDANSSSAAN
jgi:hypothetical protein